MNFQVGDALLRARRWCEQLLHRARGGKRMIQLRHQQPTVWEGLFAEEVAELWEPWMRVVDELLEDEELVDAVYEAQGKRHPQSRLRGRQQTPAEVALRMLILQHVRNWSYETLEREGGRTWSIAASAESVWRKCRMPRRWSVWDKRSGRRPSVICISHCGTGPGAACDSGAKDAGRHDGGGEQHSLPDRQWLVERWHTGADTDHEKD